MGITYKDLIFLLGGRVMKSPVRGVFGCPGSYLLGLPIITDNCRAKENFGKEGYDNSCRECWNAEVPYPVIAEVIGDTDFPGVPEGVLKIGKKFLLHNCIDSETIEIENEYLYIRGNKKGFKFYIQEEEMKKEFVNDDLKDGMMVEDANGRKWLYLGGKLRKPGMCKDCKPEDIYRFGFPRYGRNLTINELLTYGFSKIIWERKEEKEISSEEAFAILKQHYGCDVKIKER